METGRFYFVSDSFYERFKKCGLVDNKAEKNGEEHNRPCCYMFKFDNLPDMVFAIILVLDMCLVKTAN